jgi:hypothetical protein
MPKTKNAARQPYRTWIGTTSSGEIAAPTWLVIPRCPTRGAMRRGNPPAITVDAWG